MSHIRLLTRASAAGFAGLLGLATAAHAVTLRVASEEPFADPPLVAAQYALEYIEEELPKATNGAVDVRLYPNAQLGSERDLIRSVGTGTVDATIVSPGNAAALIPEVQLFSASYLFTSYEHARRTIQDDEFFNRMREIVAERETGFQLAGIGLTGTRNLYNRVREVGEEEGINGLKMRVMASPTEFEVWSTLGTLPTNIPAPEIYTALQTGVVDAAESSLPAIVGNKYYEVAPHITLTHHQFNLHLLLIGDHALANIPEEHREAVLATFREAGLQEVDAAEQLAEEKLEFLRSQPGVTVNEIDTEALAERLAGVQDTTAEELGVTDLLAMIRELR